MKASSELESVLIMYNFLYLIGLAFFLQRFPSFKGSVTRDSDGLFVVEIDRALFGDETLTVFITIYCILVFKKSSSGEKISLLWGKASIIYNISVIQRYCTMVSPLCAIGATLLQMCHMLLATLWQICYRGNPLAKF